MLLLVAPFFLLLGARAAPVESCTTFPNWTIAKFKSESTDTVGAGGSASLSLTNSLTGKTDEVTCKLQVNYRCIVVGTASDKNLTVNIAIRAGFVTLVLDQEVHDCPGRTTWVLPHCAVQVALLDIIS